MSQAYLNMQSTCGTTPKYISGRVARSGPLLVSTAKIHSVNVLLALQHLILLSKLWLIRACHPTLACFPKMADIALAIQYKCQVLRNAFSALNMTGKREASKFSVIYIMLSGTFNI